MGAFRNLIMRCAAIAASVYLVGIGSVAATSIYIDFDRSTLQGGPNVPLSTYSAAAPTAGTWNGILGKDGVYGSNTAVGALLDITGAALPGVKVDLGGSTSINPTVNAPASLGPHQALLGDYFDTSLPAPPAWLLQITGITNGVYDVNVYAPGDPSLPSSAFSVGNGPAQQNLLGSLDAILNPNLDFLFVQTTVTNNVLTVASGATVGGLAGPSGLSGIQLLQIAPIPIPAALPLFLTGMAGLGLMARGRQKKLS